MNFVIIMFSNEKLQEQAQRVYCGLKRYVEPDQRDPNGWLD